VSAFDPARVVRGMDIVNLIIAAMLACAAACAVVLAWPPREPRKLDRSSESPADGSSGDAGDG
jgi:hypothetical protein